MADENVFADVPSEGATLDIDKAFERLETKEDKTPSESQSDTKEAQQASQGADNTLEEKPEPFHKHPRWIKTQQELKETREKLEKLETERASGQAITLPDWWKSQYGDTDESKERYEAVLKGELPWLKDQIIKEIEGKQQAEQTMGKQGEEYVETQLSEMSDEGLKFDRNRLLKFMVDFQEEYGAGSLVDTEGNYDFRKALKLMNKVEPDEPESKNVQKQLASQSGRAKASSTSSKGVPVRAHAGSTTRYCDRFFPSNAWTHRPHFGIQDWPRHGSSHGR